MKSSWNLYYVWWWESPWSVMNLSCFVFFIRECQNAQFGDPTRWGPRLFGEMVSFIGDTFPQPVVARFWVLVGGSEKKLVIRCNQRISSVTSVLSIYFYQLYIYMSKFKYCFVEVKKCFRPESPGIFAADVSILSEADWMLRVANKCFIFLSGNLLNDGLLNCLSTGAGFLPPTVCLIFDIHHRWTHRIPHKFNVEINI